jgi:ATP-dependent DNA ligase
MDTYAEIRPRIARADPEKAFARVVQWWVSTKYDGWQAQWTGERFVSRTGALVIHAPPAFVQCLPRGLHLYGELFVPGHPFDVIATLRTRPEHPLWARARYMVFDVGVPDLTLLERLEVARTALRGCAAARVVDLRRVTNAGSALRAFERANAAGEEGVVFARGSALFGASRARVKLKHREDAEATVVGWVGLDPTTDAFRALRVRRGRALFSVGVGFKAGQKLAGLYPLGTIIKFSIESWLPSGAPKGPARFLGVRLAGGNL